VNVLAVSLVEALMLAGAAIAAVAALVGLGIMLERLFYDH
jgi:hypothetical protein